MASAGAIYAGISAAAALISAGVQYHTSEQQKDSQEEYNKYIEEQAIAQYAELDKQEVDVIESSYAESMQAQKDYLKARSSVELQAAATGTYGQSIDLAIQDLGAGFGQKIGEIAGKRERELDNIDTQAKNIKGQAEGSGDYSITQPSFYTAFSSGLSAYGSAYQTSSSVGTAIKESRTVSATSSAS